jgi:hypothetical protein
MSVTYNEFEKTSLEQWKSEALNDGKGKLDPEQLFYTVESGLKVSSFQTHESVVAVTIPTLPQTVAGVVVSSSDKASVMQALADGVQSLLITWQEETPIAPFFDGIYVDILDVYVDDTQCQPMTSLALKTFMTNNSYHRTIFLSDGYMSLKGASTFQDRIRLIRSRSFNIIMLELKQDFLAQIAELRAIRYIVADQDFKIIARLDPDTAISTNKQTLIDINYRIMSAYMGGADVVIGIEYTQSRSSMARLTLNIQHILQLESNINLVKDPMAGSYMVEALTNALIRID